jgi:hypothetical protein
MNNATTRTKALVAGGAALLAFGIGTLLPAQANPPHLEPGEVVGQAYDKARPPGQTMPLVEPSDGNSGFTCDGNGGVGNGNPALNPVCVVPTPTPPPPPPGGDSGLELDS